MTWGSYPIYGPGIANDTIYPFFSVTKGPVTPAFWALQNGTIRSWGGQNQYVTFPMGHSPLEYALARNFTNPNHISQWDPMLLTTGINLGSMNQTNPSLIQAGQSAAWNYGYNMAIQSQIQSACASMASALDSMEQQLTSLVKSDKFTSAQKATFQSLVEKIQAMRNKFAQKAKNATKESVLAMQQELKALQEEVSKAAEKISEQISGGSSTGSSEGSSSSSSEIPSEDLTDEDKKKIDKKHADAEKKLNQDASEIVGHVYQGAIGRIGTDYNEIKKGTNKITKDNVTRVLETYKEQYSNIDNGDMIDTLFDEEMMWNSSLSKERDSKGKIPNPKGNVDIIWNIVKCLEERAKELDLYTSLSGQFNIAYDELDDTFVDEAAVKNAVSMITAAISEKEKVANAEAIEKDYIDTAKATHKKKVEERKTKVVAEKKAEFAKQMKDALKLDKLPELTTGLNIDTDDNGEFTGYSIKLNTPSGQVEIKGATYHTFILELEKHGLKAEDLIRKTVA